MERVIPTAWPEGGDGEGAAGLVREGVVQVLRRAAVVTYLKGRMMVGRQDLWEKRSDIA